MGWLPAQQTARRAYPSGLKVPLLNRRAGAWRRPFLVATGVQCNFRIEHGLFCRVARSLLGSFRETSSDYWNNPHRCSFVVHGGLEWWRHISVCCGSRARSLVLDPSRSGSLAMLGDAGAGGHQSGRQCLSSIHGALPRRHGARSGLMPMPLPQISLSLHWLRCRARLRCRQAFVRAPADKRP